VNGTNRNAGAAFVDINSKKNPSAGFAQLEAWPYLLPSPTTSTIMLVTGTPF
jgi:hypothetical protein